LHRLAGALLALLFGYAPGLRPWYEALEPTRKALVMAGALLVAALLLYGAACYTPWHVGVTCDQTGFWTLAQLFISRPGGESGGLSHKTVAYGDGANGVG
jgi:hypothetical protein